MEYLFPTLLFLLLIVGPAIYRYRYAKKYSPPGTIRLPGPKGIPILGSVPEMPQKHPWLKLYEWGQQYGDLYEVNLAGHNTVVISSVKIVKDLLVRRANIYSDRPLLPSILHNSKTSMHYIALMGEGVDHKRGRQYVKHMIYNTPRTLVSSTTDEGSAALVLQLLANPDRWKVDVQNYIARVSAQVAWSDDDIHTAEKSIGNANKLIHRISPDGALVNKLPFLAWVPSWVPLVLQPWKAMEVARFQRERLFWMGQMDKVKSGALKGHSWASRFLFEEKEREHGISNEEEAAYATGFIAMIGGVLLSSPIQTLLLALVFYPEWQKKAQAEMEAVCGDRRPRDSDMRDLPTVRAILRETLRWRPPVPLGVPHVLEEDDVYEGYFLPKGSVCLAAEWAITRDETMYPDAEIFRPERWLDPKFPTYKEPLSQYPEIKNNSSFGWGGRACPGSVYTEIVLFTMACTILWSCNITRKKDPVTGKELDIPWLDIEPPNAIVRPTWFPLDVIARDEWRIEALRNHAQI